MPIRRPPTPAGSRRRTERARRPHRGEGLFRARLGRIYARLFPDQERTDSPGPLDIDSWSEGLRQGSWFGPVDADLIRWSQRLTPATARALWSTFSSISALPAARRDPFLDDLEALVDDLGGDVDDPRVTAVYRTRPIR